jgi:protein-tyrosine-phosphatase
MKPTRILFICFANTCRSPMAEAIARNRGGTAVEVHSAGLYPSGRVAAGSLLALETLGYPSDRLNSKGLKTIDLDSMDIIISLMGPEGLATLPPRLCAEKIAWRIPDPYGEDDDSYIRVARLLENQISSLINSLRAREPLSF